jgi:hypothetical protein
VDSGLSRPSVLLLELYILVFANLARCNNKKVDRGPHHRPITAIGSSSVRATRHRREVIEGQTLVTAA